MPNVLELSVSDLSNKLKRTIEDQFGHVRVRGEVSGYRGPHSSGHAYFCLKDDKARIDAVVWRTAFAALPFRPEEGLEVIATGKLTTYPGSSKYQIVIETLEPAGAGALMALLNERKARLEAEGLFAAARKRPLPYLPNVVGVVTSPTGAVIRDILHRVADRFPLHVLVWPVRVQGETSAAEVTAAIEGFNAIEPGGPVPRPDVLIVARGGGSLEDLWGFNDETLVRAAAASAIPLVSAVGHETDWTLLDHAADRRAPTPTGAAEIVVPVRAELKAVLAGLEARLGGAVTRRLDREARALAATARALPAPDMLLALPRRRLDEAESGLTRGLSLALSDRRRHLAESAGRLSPGILDGALRERRARLRQQESDAARGIGSILHRLRRGYDEAASGLQPHIIRARSEAARLRLDALGAGLQTLERRAAERRRETLGGLWRIAGTLDPRKVLERGYAIVYAEDGRTPITRADALGPGTRFQVEFANPDWRPDDDPATRTQRREAVATDGDAPLGSVPGDRTLPAAPIRRRAARAKAIAPGQGSLF
ncbi:exodeoxyribonuclease VII large subunit [Aurantimonas sp. Leaf443]|nr:exodeoxyribonuclease VII large subunit [Aurantimonas sp. Leaf443]